MGPSRGSVCPPSSTRYVSDSIAVSLFLQRLSTEKNPREQRSRDYECRSGGGPRGVCRGDRCCIAERKHRGLGSECVPHRAVDRSMAKEPRIGFWKLTFTEEVNCFRFGWKGPEVGEGHLLTICFMYNYHTLIHVACWRDMIEKKYRLKIRRSGHASATPGSAPATRVENKQDVNYHSARLPSSISTSPSFCCSSACSTVIDPAGRQMFPVVAFHSRMRPSFPAEDKTVLTELERKLYSRRMRKRIPCDVPLNPVYRRSVYHVG
jgi:hypothetical protein